MDLRASQLMAKFRWKTDKYVVKVLQRAKKMGIYLPNLCNLHKDQKVTGGHGKIPRQAKNL
jgi:hypothetical protein